ncbi:MAG: M20/M25/M40 family metallo-hydrolase [Kineosporiaceae bacterium]
MNADDGTPVEPDEFDRFLDELRERFPLLHARLDVQHVHTYGLLMRWPGRGNDRPIVLMAHLDVVPADAQAPWRYPPFDGVLADGHLWGRGTLDDKGSLVAICAAVESLLTEDITPAQDVWLSFGCDEEVAGVSAGLAVSALERQGVRPWFVLDEGGAVATGALPGIAAPLAVIGVAEKGITNVELRVDGPGGHASTPKRNGPAVRIARAVTRLDRARLPAHVPGPTAEMVRRLAPHAPRWLRPVLRRLAETGPLLGRVLVLAGPETAAMTRTTIAVTTLSGSPALNAIASTARAGLNIRVLPGETVTEVLQRLRRIIRDDDVQLDVRERNEPSPISPVDDDAFRLIEATATDVFPDAVPVPYVMTAGTDSRHFTGLCPRVYRFAPLRMTREQRATLHAHDERVGVDDLVDAVTWYRRLLLALPEPPPD